MHLHRTRARCDNSGKSLEVSRVQECIRGERFLGDGWHSAELDKRICRGNKREVLLGRGTEVSDGGDEREGVYL